jgi:hypothetical protein
MYRLVNVPANPEGRLGAPETEPGPSGVGDELTTISFARLDRAFVQEDGVGAVRR